MDYLKLTISICNIELCNMKYFDLSIFGYLCQDIPYYICKMI